MGRSVTRSIGRPGRRSVGRLVDRPPSAPPFWLKTILAQDHFGSRPFWLKAILAPRRGEVGLSGFVAGRRPKSQRLARRQPRKVGLTRSRSRWAWDNKSMLSTLCSIFTRRCVLFDHYIYKLRKETIGNGSRTPEMPQQSSVSARSEPLKYRISSECEEKQPQNDPVHGN